MVGLAGVEHIVNNDNRGLYGFSATISTISKECVPTFVPTPTMHVTIATSLSGQSISETSLAQEINKRNENEFALRNKTIETREVRRRQGSQGAQTHVSSISQGLGGRAIRVGERHRAEGGDGRSGRSEKARLCTTRMCVCRGLEGVERKEGRLCDESIYN